MQGIWKDKYKNYVKDKKYLVRKVYNSRLNLSKQEAFDLFRELSFNKDYKERTETISEMRTCKKVKVKLEYIDDLDKKFKKKNCENCQYNPYNNTNEQEKVYNLYEEEYLFYNKRTCSYIYDSLNYSSRLMGEVERSCDKVNKIIFKKKSFDHDLYIVDGEYKYLDLNNMFQKLPSLYKIVKIYNNSWSETEYRELSKNNKNFILNIKKKHSVPRRRYFKDFKKVYYDMDIYDKRYPNRRTVKQNIKKDWLENNF